MDFFDQRILAVLKDGKPRGFAAILEVGFSHNTLQQHLRRLVEKGLVLRRKILQVVLEGPDLSITSSPKLLNRSLLLSKIPS